MSGVTSGVTKKNIVLVQPRTGHWDLAGARPPDSLLSIAAAPLRAGYNIKIIDQRIDRNWEQTLRRELKDALVFGTTSMTGPQIRYALEASKLVKSISSVPVVWGGVHASLLPEQTVQNDFIDIVLKGEGDFAFLELIRAIEGNSLDTVKGIYFKRDGKVVRTAERDLIKNLDDLPDWPYELIEIDRYYGFNIAQGRSITLMTSRGCPFRCAFCYNTVYYNNTWRGMSAKRAVQLISNVVQKYGVRNIFFEDDNFSANVSRFEEIVNRILEEKLRVSWGLLGTRVNTLKRMSDELLAKTVKAGCVNIDVGIESGSERLLNLVSKDMNIADALEVNKRLRKYFDKTKYTFIMGMPTETEEELLSTVKLATRLSKDNPNALPMFFTYCAYPGTRLYDIAIEQGFREPKKLEDWADINFETAVYRYPWLDKRRIKMMMNYGFTSMFVSSNASYKIQSPMFRVLARLYQPLAKLRFEHNLYQFPAERVLAKWLSEKMT